MVNNLGTIDDLELAAHLRSGLGLILGPVPGQFPAAADSLAEALSTAKGGEYFEVAERALDSESHSDADIRAVAKELLLKEAAQRTQSRSNELMASFQWRGVLSCALDTEFDLRFRARVSAVPSPRDVVTLDDLTQQPPPRAIPVFHLLGTLQGKEWVCTKGDYREWKTRWPMAARLLADRLKGGPIVCVGMGQSSDIFLDLVSCLSSIPQFERLQLIVPAEDGDSATPAVRRQLGPGMKILIYSGDLKSLLKACASAKKSGFTLPLGFGSATSEYSWFESHRDLAVCVNEQVNPSLRRSDVLQLRECLFSPDTLRWDPFCFELDLRRTIEAEVLWNIANEPDQFKDVPCVAGVVLGGAASGKTTLLKRIALQLAKNSYLVFWIKPWVYQDGLAVARKFMNAVKRNAAGLRVILCMDDPPALYGIHPNHLALAAADADVRVLFLIAARTSDWETENQRTVFIGDAVSVFEERLADELDDAEWSRLPQFLVTLGVAKDVGAAAAQVSERVFGRDALCALYYLLPETQHAIKDSIQQEYSRLGRESLGRLVRALASSGSRLLQRAYGMIAVGETLGAHVPIEVLVSALECDYGAWIDTLGGTPVALGILYEQRDETGESISYRLRNSVVARSVREVVNGGTLGVSGELALLGELLGACNGSSPVYRAFCLKVLVGNHRLEHYPAAALTNLYERAIGALPHEDATLLHHQAIHLRKTGDAEGAIKCLDRALNAAPYPYSDRQEQEEHIHTSYAATILSLLSKGKLSEADAKERFQRHLDRARSESFFNARAIHLQAVYAIKLADRVKGGSEVDALGLLDRALSDIERYRLIVTAPQERFTSDQEGKKLYEIRDEILGRFKDIEGSVENAQRLWSSYKSQVGFVLVARSLLATAQNSFKGSAFKKANDYCAECISLLRIANTALDSRLVEIALTIYFQWRVRRPATSPQDIDWGYIADLAAQLVSHAKSHPTFKYMLGLSLAHLGRWPDAHRVFRELRESKIQSSYLWSQRDVLRRSARENRQVQGTVGRGAKDAYLSIPELDTDIPASRKEQWPRNGETALAFVVFSFGGPTAVQSLS